MAGAFASYVEVAWAGDAGGGWSQYFSASMAAEVTHYSRADLERMAGQMVLVGFRGTSINDADVKQLLAEMKAGRLGGVMYLKTNVKSLAAVEKMNQAFLGTGSELPPFISLDQEGGAVQRLGPDVGIGPIPSADTVAKTFASSPAGARLLYQGVAHDLADAGFNLNFGPVVDLNINPKNPIIARYGRSFGKDPDVVEAFAEAFVAGHHAENVLTALKHFPGHGSSTGDSHKGFVDVTTTWKRDELQPYEALINAPGPNHVDLVMVGHLFNAKFDPPSDAELLPASLSPFWIRQVLRTDLCFDGPVISDDLEMGAIRREFDLHDTVVKAVTAGVDVLLFSNTAKYDPNLSNVVREILVTEALRDPDFAEDIATSYSRIKNLKRAWMAGLRNRVSPVKTALEGALAALAQAKAKQPDEVGGESAAPAAASPATRPGAAQPTTLPPGFDGRQADLLVQQTIASTSPRRAACSPKLPAALVPKPAHTSVLPVPRNRNAPSSASHVVDPH
jgi:beta-N-acetylhexosaminidase